MRNRFHDSHKSQKKRGLSTSLFERLLPLELQRRAGIVWLAVQAITDDASLVAEEETLTGSARGCWSGLHQVGRASRRIDRQVKHVAALRERYGRSSRQHVVDQASIRGSRESCTGARYRRATELPECRSIAVVRIRGSIRNLSSVDGAYRADR